MAKMIPEQINNGGLSAENEAVLSAQVGYPLRKRHTMFEGELWQLQSWFEAIRADERSRLSASEGPHPESGEALPVVDRILADLDGIIKGVRSGSYSVSDIDSLLCRTIREAEAFKAAARPSPGVSREEVARIIGDNFNPNLTFDTSSMATQAACFRAADALSLHHRSLCGIQEELAVQEVQMLSVEDIFGEPAPSVWRIELDGYCADFQSEVGAKGFRDALLALISRGEA